MTRGLPFSHRGGRGIAFRDTTPGEIGRFCDRFLGFDPHLHAFLRRHAAC